MQSDEGYHRFFSYLNFFVFSMLLLVLAGNFVLLIVGWAFVGFASYALISFWYRRTTATRAGMKAFVINVVGDIGLVLAAFLIFRELGTFEYGEVFAKAPQVFHTNQWTVTAICLLLLVGAFAKSAQLPFHTWLPDAMEGPTPVSSLIHAATMVTAGVYLIARTHALFVLAPTAADIAAFVGLATLLVAGTIALVMTDLKRAIAYSTMSQIGYMIMGVSIGAYSAGMFHLMTHAFFKALLFMAAGSIIAGDGQQAEHRRDERLRQGDALHLDHDALRRPRARRLPRHLGLLLQGRDPRLRRPPAAGCTRSSPILGYFGALLTAIYTFRLIFRVLPGRPCKEAQELIDTGHVAPRARRSTRRPAKRRTPTSASRAPSTTSPSSRAPMRVAMGVLAFLALFAGLVQVPGVDETITNFLDPVFADSPLAAIAPSVGAAWAGLAIGAAISLAGIGIAYWLYIAAPGDAGGADPPLRPAPHLPRQQVVLRRGDRPPRRPPGAGDRPLRQPRLRALRRRRPRHRHRGDRARRRRRRPRRPERLRPQLRAAADRRLRRARPLLPDLSSS